MIAVDALAARSSKRIASTIQIADTGITPGSGVGNHRKALDRETLGVPVVAVGVPLVVYASTIAADALCALGEGEVEEERIAACVQRVVSEKLGEMIVTPREVDALVERCRRLGIPRVFVFTLAESFFSNCGFQEFQRESLPPVVWVECSKCPKFYRCDEIGMIRTL